MSEFNEAPKGWKPITEAEFAQSLFFSFDPEKVEYRQILTVEGKPVQTMIAARLYWFYDKTGVALASDYWKGKVQYYWFGCNHQFETNERGKRACKDCGFVAPIFDSSG